MPDAETLLDRIEQPAGVPDRLAAQIRFIVEIDKLKTVLRRSKLVAAERRENDAEHSWHLAVMVAVLAEHADEPIDTGHTIQLVLLHDLVEIYAGDTFLYDAAARKDQDAREQAAAEQLFPLLPADQATRWRALWDEFEARRTPEARFAKAMDRLQPMLLNFNNRGGTWQAPGVTADQVRAGRDLVGDASVRLGSYLDSLIDTAAERGWLREDTAGGQP